MIPARTDAADWQLKAACLTLTMALVLTAPSFARLAQSTDRQQAGAASSDITAHATQPPDQYVIGPGDILAVNVWRETELSRVVPVRPDGKISLALIGEIQASGLTALKLRDAITEKLKAYVSKPEVTVIVQEVKSQKFTVVGEVVRPGEYDMTRPTTTLDAIAIAGGFQEFAKVKKIYVLRVMPDGTRKKIPFNYRAVIKGQPSGQNVELKPGDTIVVP